MIFLLASILFWLATLADLWMTRYAEARGAEESNWLLRRRDGCVSTPKKLLVSAVPFFACCWLERLGSGWGAGLLWAGAAFFGIVALSSWVRFRKLPVVRREP